MKVIQTMNAAKHQTALLNKQIIESERKIEKEHNHELRIYKTGLY